MKPIVNVLSYAARCTSQFKLRSAYFITNLHFFTSLSGRATSAEFIVTPMLRLY